MVSIIIFVENSCQSEKDLEDGGVLFVIFWLHMLNTVKNIEGGVLWEAKKFYRVSFS